MKEDRILISHKVGSLKGCTTTFADPLRIVREARKHIPDYPLKEGILPKHAEGVHSSDALALYLRQKGSANRGKRSDTLLSMIVMLVQDQGSISYEGVNEIVFSLCRSYGIKPETLKAVIGVFAIEQDFAAHASAANAEVLRAILEQMGKSEERNGNGKEPILLSY